MKKIRAKWYEVGIGLKVDDTFLDELEGKGLSDERTMLKTLKKWLEDYDEAKLGGKPSWRMLARIAGRHRMDVAREIAQNHPINPPASSQPAGTYITNATLLHSCYDNKYVISINTAGISTRGEMDLARLNSKEPWRHALRELRPTIADAIGSKSSLDRFGDLLAEKHFITEGVKRDRVDVAVNGYKKATSLLDAVSTDINNAPNKVERFNDFVGILNTLALTDIAKQLTDCYSKHASQ